MYNTYLCDQNQQSIFNVFFTDLKKNRAGIAGDTVDPSELRSEATQCLSERSSNSDNVHDG